MASQNPIPGQQPAEDNEIGVTVETVGDTTDQVVPQPEEQAGDSGTPSEQPPEGGDAPGGQPDADAAAAAATQKKEKSDVQKRIDTLTRRRYELEGRNEELEVELARMKRRLAALEGEPAPEKPAQQAADSEKPVRDTFATYEEWVEAVSLYNARKALREKDEEAQRQAQTTQQATIVENWNKSIETAREKYEDFDVVVGTNLQIPQAAFNAIVDSPVGTDIAYFLGSNPDIAASLSKLTPIACVRAIGRIESQFQAPAPAPAPTPTPAPATPAAGAPGASQSKGQASARPAAVQRPKPITSNASAPVAPVGARTVTQKNPDEMSYQEYKAWREAGNGRR